MRIAESELIINEDGSCFHLHLKPNELADNVILVGDPGRVSMVATYLDDVEFDRTTREFHSVTGRYNGKRVTVISTGIGTDNCDIVMNELDALANIDFKTREIKAEHRTLNILRIGTSGAIQPDIPLGSFVFAKMSLGCDGLMNWYADRRKIAVPRIGAAFKKHVGWNRHLCDPYFVKAGKDMCKRFEDCAIQGITISAQGFYGPQGRVLRMRLAMPDMIEKFASFGYEGMRLTNFEMESSAIAGIGKMLGHNCGTICLILAQRSKKGVNTDIKKQMEKLVKLSLDRLTSC